MTRNDNLTARQQRFVQALMVSPSVKAAAVAAGIGEKTGHRYLGDPKVKAALNNAQGLALEQVTRRAVNAMTESLDTLRAIMSDPSTPPGTRVQAAKAVLEHATRLNDAVILSNRIADIESLAGGEV